jgi:plastocyanin
MKTKKLLILMLLTLPVKISLATTHIVNVEDYEFNPAVLTVNVGDTIMWMWDHGFHTTTSTTIPAGSSSWNSAVDQSNPMFTYVISTPGSYDYICIYHESMGMVGHIEATGTTGIEQANADLSFLAGTVCNSTVKINYPSDSHHWQIELQDLTGKTVKSFTSVAAERRESFMIEDLSTGVYILTINDGSRKYSDRIIKE